MEIKIPEVRQRVGIIEIPTLIIECEPDISQKVFEKFIPFRAEHLYAKSVFSYMGYSKHFDVIPEASVVPHYDVIATKGEFKIDITFKRSIQESIHPNELLVSIQQIKAQEKKEKNAKTGDTKQENRESSVSV